MLTLSYLQQENKGIPKGEGSKVQAKSQGVCPLGREVETVDSAAAHVKESSLSEDAFQMAMSENSDSPPQNIDL